MLLNWKEWYWDWNSSIWPPHSKIWLIGKDSDAGRDGGQEEKGTTEDEMAGWHHGLNGHEFGWTWRVGDGQGGLACCDSWGHKESDMTERLNWTECAESAMSRWWKNSEASIYMYHFNLLQQICLTKHIINIIFKYTMFDPVYKRGLFNMIKFTLV